MSQKNLVMVVPNETLFRGGERIVFDTEELPVIDHSAKYKKPERRNKKQLRLF